ncbi:MAG: SPOR domain-containing protein [Legionella sp.]|nr:SPOR domain-containing protein [Legionella sp.]
MNLAIDERTKHRLTGLVVIIAVAIIFVPAMLKKSNQHLEENIHVSVQLPPKPTLPKVAIAEEKAVFETVKVAKVALPKPIEAIPESEIARIETKQFTQKTQATQTTQASATAYAVQLAVFNQQKNAKKLVADLRDQGYKAGYQTLTSNAGTPFYKVTVGQLNDRTDAHALKNKLIESTKLKGFVIKQDMG